MMKYDLEDRLIAYSVNVIKLIDTIPKDQAGNHLSNQLIRSSTSPALNYGEAQSGESRRDFIHKMKIALKELRETNVCLKIIQQLELCGSKEELANVLVETNELISIFVKSIETARKNMVR